MAQLTEKELFHIALRDIQEGNHSKGLSQLKELIEINPEYSDAQFLLGAEYAQLGLYSEAKVHLKITLDLDPMLDLARFQLGLVHLAVGEFNEVRAAMNSVIESNDGNYLARFALGIKLCVENNPEDAIKALEEGIEMNKENPSLNNDMTGVITSLQSQRQESSIETNHSNSEEDTKEPEELAGSDYLLGAYKN